MTHQPNAHSTRRTREQGFALVVVLACLIFITALTVTFLTSMRTEVINSKASQDSGSVRLLGETCINLVMSQIQGATVLAGSNSWAWASQPGMIRLYNNQGQPAGFRKLYSSNVMVGTEAFDSTPASGPKDDPIPADWSDKPSLWTDLNAPVTSGTVKSYPILDPDTAIDHNDQEGAASPATAIDQFTINDAPLATTGTSPNAAPMPVRWLYVLQDGSLAPAEPSAAGTAVTVSGTSPIVGRIAFWTDDDTCKVNINTASYAANTGNDPANNWRSTFWDTPRFNIMPDRAFGLYPPATHEYQRYPGHPATVTLSGIFPSLTSTNIYSMVPRISAGGSEDSTKLYEGVMKGAPLVTDRDRLYASVDELMFRPDLAGTTRNEQFATPLLTPAQLEATRFFLTANSRAPELNLFGKPRIAIWPIHVNSGTNYRSQADQLIAFCATSGTGATSYPFYFTRAQSWSTTGDITLTRNAALLNYLDDLTQRNVPGFGGSFATKFDTDRRQILTEIFDYIRCTSLRDPTVQQPFAQEYKCANNQKDSYWFGIGQAIPSNHVSWDTQGFGGKFFRVNEAAFQFTVLAQNIADDKSFDVTNKLQQGKRIKQAVVSGTWSAGEDEYRWVKPPPETKAVQAYFLLSFLNPGHTQVADFCDGFWVEVQGLDAITLSSTIPLTTGTTKASQNNPGYMGFPFKESMFIGAAGGGGIPQGSPHEAQTSFMDPSCMTSSGIKIALSGSIADGCQRFPFYSHILAVSASAGTPVPFSGGKITINIYAGANSGNLRDFNGNKGPLVQTIRMTFPSIADLGLPRLTKAVVPIGTQQEPDRWLWKDTDVKHYFDPDSDVVKSMVLDKGDVRLVAGRTVTGVFKPHQNYGTHQFAFGFRGGEGYPLGYGGTLPSAPGKLAAGASYRTEPPGVRMLEAPAVPSHILTAGLPNGWGDWDNGMGLMSDGPWINQPDEGNLYWEATTAKQDAEDYAKLGLHNARIPYFDISHTSGTATVYAPNRIMPSPGMFGSLPTGVKRNMAWQTLLFQPGLAGHPGAVNPKDHLLLDLFWMPIVQPYAISEPFSTAGKINLNQQIVPFTYINRKTALRAALASERVTVMPKDQADKYKVSQSVGDRQEGAVCTGGFRLPLNLSEADGTLRQIKEKFNRGEIFKSASEICDIYLVPESYAWTQDSDAQSAWYGKDFALVGDNTRERPYADLYNKLTTKSNTYTVHYRAQTLRIPKRLRTADPNTQTFDPAQGCEVSADYRGSATIERYIDPNDEKLRATDPAATTAPSLENLYRFHVISAKAFVP